MTARRSYSNCDVPMTAESIESDPIEKADPIESASSLLAIAMRS
jgi:hypothetical protein